MDVWNKCDWNIIRYVVTHVILLCTKMLVKFHCITL